ncbi:hypothetical protein EA796_00960 [Pseudomonas sp. AOB-7]|uniref:hypothetical protein n=1 Tax=Pseudomonas sp. AOB-7 TaxID=2482750 RepID=UPI000EFAC01A|nr:hypothetical protein [Pseudomonas sp. AOB-7]RMH86432.1 hypothetical protein EA796_00960 [Pseudomonas sp. AOB-7]
MPYAINLTKTTGSDQSFAPLLDWPGTTYRVFVPGTPAVTRSEDELADDQAAGLQWRNEAMLSGGFLTLHRRALSGWIYTDPAGVRWWARCELLNDNYQHDVSAPLTLTLLLARFGEFVAAPESYSYSVTVIDFGLAGGHPLQVPAGLRLRALIDDIRHDGSRVSVMLHQRLPTGDNPDIRRPFSWLELSIAGPGQDASVAIAVAHSITASTVVSTVRAAPSDYLAGDLTEWVDGVPQEPEFVVLPGSYGEGGNPPGPEHHEEDGAGNLLRRWRVRAGVTYSGSASFQLSRIAAVWYDAEGEATPLWQDYQASFDIAWPVPDESGLTSSMATQWTVRWRLGEAELGAVAGSGEASMLHEWNPLTFGTVNETLESVVDGASTSSSQTYEHDAFNWRHATVTPFGALNLASTDADAAKFAAKEFARFGYVPNFQPIRVVRYSNHVIGMRVQRPSDPVAYAFHPPITPSGIAAGEVHVSTNLSLVGRYGSWCPATGQAVWRLSSPASYV